MLQSGDLTTDQQVEGDLRDEQAGAGAVGVADCSSDVVVGEAVEWVDCAEAPVTRGMLNSEGSEGKDEEEALELWRRAKRR